MLSNTVTKLGGVFLFALPAVVVGGQIYSLVAGAPLTEGLLKIYVRLHPQQSSCRLSLSCAAAASCLRGPCVCTLRRAKLTAALRVLLWQPENLHIVLKGSLPHVRAGGAALAPCAQNKQRKNLLPAHLAPHDL